MKITPHYNRVPGCYILDLGWVAEALIVDVKEFLDAEYCTNWRWYGETVGKRNGLVYYELIIYDPSDFVLVTLQLMVP